LLIHSLYPSLRRPFIFIPDSDTERRNLLHQNILMFHYWGC
jgi:hypothetical protein